MLSKAILKRIFVKCLLRRNLPISLVPEDYKLPVETKTIDNMASKLGYIPCNVNFDDLCPQYGGKLGLDFGGNVGKGLSVKIRRLLEDYPHIAVTFFVVPNAMIYRNFLSSFWHCRDKYDISSPSHAIWLEYYKSMAKTYNIEYAMHGCYHFQKENPFFARHTEFAFKNEDETHVAVRRGMQIFDECGWQVSGFRQPGWDINSDLNICRVLKKLGVNYIAGSSLDVGFNSGGIERVSNYYPTLINGLINFPQNVLLDWRIEKIYNQIDKIVGMEGMISIKGHFVSERMSNSFSSANIAKLRQALDYLSNKYDEKVEHFTLKQIAERINDIC
jgi:predicted deacetylase